MASVDLEMGESTEMTIGTEVRADPASPPSWDEATDCRPLGFGADSFVEVVEWDGPGKAALLVLAGSPIRHRTARLYRRVNKGLGLVFDTGTPIPGLGGIVQVCSVPTEGPARFDLIARDESVLVYLRNSGTWDSPRFETLQELPADLGLGAGRIAQMAAVDWDGDGRTDLLLGLDELEGYWPDGDRIPHRQQIGFNQKGGHPGYDRDGRWRGNSPRGRVVWLRNVGTPAEPRFGNPEVIGPERGELDLTSRPAPLIVSWGGQGAWEFLVADDRGQVRLHRNFGGQRPPVLMEPRPLRASGRPLVLPGERTALSAADLDGDRRPAILFGSADGRVFAIQKAPGRDETTGPEPIVQEAGEFWTSGGAVLTAGDLDGDGGLDLIVGDAPGRLWQFSDRGGRRYGLPTLVEAGGEPFRLDPGPDGLLGGPADRRLGFSAPAMVDWTGHGRLDLLVGGAGGEVVHLRNNGTLQQPRFDVPKPIKLGGSPLITPSRVRPAAGDWSGTGSIDLIALDLQGFLCVYPRIGPGEVGPPVPLTDRLGRLIRLDGGFGRGGLCTLWAGPWDEPGRIDLIVGLPRGSRHVAADLLGIPLTDLDALPTVLLLENLGHGQVVPRSVRLADGRPLIVGADGCSPVGLPGPGGLLVGADDGRVEAFARTDLRW